MPLVNSKMKSVLEEDLGVSIVCSGAGLEPGEQTLS